MANQSARFATCVWIMCMFIVGSVYKSNLAAMLTTPKLQIPFSTLEEAIDQKSVKIILYKGTFIDQHIKAFNKGTKLRRLSDEAIRMNINTENYDKLLDANTHALSMVKSGLDGFIHKAFVKNEHCTRTKIPTTFLSISMGIAFQKNSSLIKKFNHVIAAFTESGIYDHLQKADLTKLSFCKVIKRTISHESRKLTLSDFFGIFFLFGSGMVLATAAFVTELTMKKIFQPINL